MNDARELQGAPASAGGPLRRVTIAVGETSAIVDDPAGPKVILKSGRELAIAGATHDELQAWLFDMITQHGPSADASYVTRLILQERLRQVHQEGHTAAHDDQHDREELALAAAWYALPESYRLGLKNLGASFHPWAEVGPSDAEADRVRDLVIAGALIVAELERLERAKADDLVEEDDADDVPAPVNETPPEEGEGNPDPAPVDDTENSPGEPVSVDPSDAIARSVRIKGELVFGLGGDLGPARLVRYDTLPHATNEALVRVVAGVSRVRISAPPLGVVRYRRDRQPRILNDWAAASQPADDGTIGPFAPGYTRLEAWVFDPNAPTEEGRHRSLVVLHVRATPESLPLAGRTFAAQNHDGFDHIRIGDHGLSVLDPGTALDISIGMFNVERAVARTDLPIVDGYGKAWDRTRQGSVNWAPAIDSYATTVHFGADHMRGDFADGGRWRGGTYFHALAVVMRYIRAERRNDAAAAAMWGDRVRKMVADNSLRYAVASIGSWWDNDNPDDEWFGTYGYYRLPTFAGWCMAIAALRDARLLYTCLGADGVRRVMATVTQFVRHVVDVHRYANSRLSDGMGDAPGWDSTGCDLGMWSTAYVPAVLAAVAAVPELPGADAFRDFCLKRGSPLIGHVSGVVKRPGLWGVFQIDDTGAAWFYPEIHYFARANEAPKMAWVVELTLWICRNRGWVAPPHLVAFQREAAAGRVRSLKTPNGPPAPPVFTCLTPVDLVPRDQVDRVIREGHALSLLACAHDYPQP